MFADDPRAQEDAFIMHAMQDVTCVRLTAVLLGIYFYIRNRKKKEIKTLLFFCRNRHGNSMVHTKSISIRGNVAR